VSTGGRKNVEKPKKSQKEEGQSRDGGYSYGNKLADFLEKGSHSIKEGKKENNKSSEFLKGRAKTHCSPRSFEENGAASRLRF